MELNVTIVDAANEVYRKIGRNVILFQKLELLLKFIVANGKFSGIANELKDRIAQRANSVNKQTMGTLVGHYIEHSNPDCEEYPSEHEDKNKLHISFGFWIECDSKYYETKKEALARMVLERNALIHNLLPTFDINSLESCEEIGRKLDDQSENINKEIKEMKYYADALIEGRKELINFIASEQGKKQLYLAFSQESRLVWRLANAATQIRRHDGWALMSMAGTLVKNQAPEEYSLMKEKYGYKSLKAMILATGIFDIYEEPTKDGGVRVLYRLKSGWECPDIVKE